MPLIKIGKPNTSYTDLVEELAKEISGETSGTEPVIYEHRSPENDVLHIIVVWSKWKNVPPQRISLIIVDAYDKAKPETAAEIATAVGVTMEDGVRLGVLPYQVMPGTSDSAEARRLAKKEFLKLGGIVSRGEWILGFLTEEKAHEAMNILKKRVRGMQWKVFTTPAISDE